MSILLKRWLGKRFSSRDNAFYLCDDHIVQYKIGDHFSSNTTRRTCQNMIKHAKILLGEMPVWKACLSENHHACLTQMKKGRLSRSVLHCKVIYKRLEKAIGESHDPQDWTCLIIPAILSHWQMQQIIPGTVVASFGQSCSLWLQIYSAILMSTTDASPWYFFPIKIE